MCINTVLGILGIRYYVLGVGAADARLRNGLVWGCATAMFKSRDLEVQFGFNGIKEFDIDLNSIIRQLSKSAVI